MLHQLTRELYSQAPKETIYHYTSFSGFMGIVESRMLWTSDIRYMNDSAELNHMVNLINDEVNERIQLGHPNPALLSQLTGWLRGRVSYGHLLFTGSFRENGNLLSQWRGYSILGKGVSIGFNPSHILQCAKQSGFMVGRCIYEPQRQQDLIHQMVDIIEDLASQQERGTSGRAEPCYEHVFEQVENELLRIGALLKHPSFAEEAEWRIVSPIISDYSHQAIRYREGNSMLVPFLEFPLQMPCDAPLKVEHIFLGPTPNAQLSMNSLKMFLKKHHIVPARGTAYCNIPYRKH